MNHIRLTGKLENARYEVVGLGGLSGPEGHVIQIDLTVEGSLLSGIRGYPEQIRLLARHLQMVADFVYPLDDSPHKVSQPISEPRSIIKAGVDVGESNTLSRAG